MAKLILEMAGEAKPQGSKTAYVVKGRAVLVESSKDLKKIRMEMSLSLARQAAVQGWQKVERPAAALVDIIFTFVKPVSVKREHMTVTPDLDKLTRFCLDAVTQAGNIWSDDSQVIEIKATKTYGATAKTQITISRPELAGA